jgi:anti-sigma factor RsiW
VALESRESLVRYVLGELPEAHRDRIAREAEADDSLRATLTEVENDLIDSYARGDLSATEREQVEKHLLASPEGREHLEVARLLMDPVLRGEIVASVPMPDRTARSYSAESWRPPARVSRRSFVLVLTAAAGLVGAAILLGVATYGPRTQRNRIQAEQPTPPERPGVGPTAQRDGAQARGPTAGDLRPAATLPSATVSILVIPSVAREAEDARDVNRLTIGRQVSEVVLELDLRRDPLSNYDVAVETAEGRVARRVAGIRSETGPGDRRRLMVRVPSRVLQPGGYVVTVSGKDALGNPQVIESYSLSVSR